MPLMGLSGDLAGKLECAPPVLALARKDAAAVSKASAALSRLGLLVGVQ